VPADITFKSKPELALAMVETVAAAGSLRYRWLACDEGFGDNPPFLDGVARHAWYLAEVSSTTHVWVERPQTAVPAWSGRGPKPNRPRLLAGQPASQAVAPLIDQIPQDQWQRYTIKEGAKGPLVADFVASRVVNVRNRLPGAEVWLICRRDAVSGERKYYLSNAPAKTPLPAFVRVSGMRWPIESIFEEGKQELGLGDYQVRSWIGWHHHMTLSILAHFFIVRTKRRLGDKAPDLTLPQAILLLKAVLPQPKFDLETTVEVVNYYQRRHRAARHAHRKRRIKHLNDSV
jgi:SRSO17 transposase